MVAAGEDDLTCDFAETYHIYDWRGLPADYAAVLAIGLRDNSRIKMRLGKTRISVETMLSAIMADALQTLVWFKTKDGAKGRNRPASILSVLTGVDKRGSGAETFASGAEFERRRKQILEGLK